MCNSKQITADITLLTLAEYIFTLQGQKVKLETWSCVGALSFQRNSLNLVVISHPFYLPIIV